MTDSKLQISSSSTKITIRIETEYFFNTSKYTVITDTKHFNILYKKERDILT